MFSLLLIVIYLAFISLGLPDSLLGSAWPIMNVELDVPMSYAGIVTMIIAGSTIISSLLSDRLTSKIGTGRLTCLSVLTTAVALWGFSISRSFLAICLWAIPYGLGAGAVDAALNNYIALHYASRHMNWLHSFWGVGASISPYVMSYFLIRNNNWHKGYQAIAIVQFILTAILFISLPLWKPKETSQAGTTKKKHSQPQKISQTLRLKGLPYALVALFAYCALEQTTGLWATSYLVQTRYIDSTTAAKFASLFFLGITAGRFISGFISERLGDRRLIRMGILTFFLGVFMIILPTSYTLFPLVGLVIVGLGSAPVYPALMHASPDNFGVENSQAAIGVQMASAYIGTTFMPPLFGLIATKISINLFPIYLVLLAVVMIYTTEKLNLATKFGKKSHTLYSSSLSEQQTLTINEKEADAHEKKD
ncbi:MFS transporter [Vagococcus elongatus]|uniref:MFS transporter n=1 Tax=Vagococcus elongatus TaxID=180344 RepID=A0A430AQZ4_9ENTE|nr:MFS transporter [Vagococcus elongatus]RSU10551.1 MFS transporter [Vagococcus elongatus]